MQRLNSNVTSSKMPFLIDLTENLFLDFYWNAFFLFGMFTDYSSHMIESSHTVGSLTAWRLGPPTLCRVENPHITCQSQPWIENTVHCHISLSKAKLSFTLFSAIVKGSFPNGWESHTGRRQLFDKCWLGGRLSGMYGRGKISH